MAIHKRKPDLYVLKVTPINLPVLFVLKFFFHIIHWRFDRVKETFLEGFEPLDASEICTLDEWYLLNEDIARSCRELANQWQKYQDSFKIKIGTIEIDLFRCWLQRLIILYEEHVQFLFLVRQHLCKTQNPSHAIASTFLYQNAPALCAHFVTEGLRFLNAFAYLDGLWLWIYGIHSVCGHVRTLFNFSRHKVNVSNDAVWFYGISPYEISEMDSRMDFSVVRTRNLISEKNAVFFLTFVPTHRQQKKLSERGVHWICAAHFQRNFRLSQRLKICRRAFSIFWDSFFMQYKKKEHIVKLQLLLHVLPWLELMEHGKPKLFLNSLSSCWPEPPIVSMMNAFRIRTATWFYSANLFGRTDAASNFSNLGIPHSIWESKEVWVWNRATEHWIKDRLLLDDDSRIQFQVLGPMMYGDSRLLEQDPVPLRIKHGIPEKRASNFFIAVFDTAQINQNNRSSRGLGPLIYTKEQQGKIARDMQLILEQFPTVHFILKLKRAVQSIHAEYSDAFLSMVDPSSSLVKEGRLLILGHDVDPYLPIALSDLCLGQPFSSPVMAGWFAKKPGFFYDPLNQVHYSYREAPIQYVLHSFTELIETLRKFAPAESRQRVTHEFFRCLPELYGEPHMDVGLHFSKLLQQNQVSNGEKLVALPNRV